MRPIRSRTRFLGLSALAIAAIVPTVVWRSAHDRAHHENSLNYRLSYSMPTGWKAVEHSPQTMFQFKNGDGVMIKAGKSQIVDDENPTPELDRDTLSENFASMTRSNLGWQAAMGDVIEFNGGSYRLIRREGKDRTIISAVAVRGNTTVIITLAAIGPAKSHVDEALPSFRDFLGNTKFTLQHFD
jgi:hypothetical protein